MIKRMIDVFAAFTAVMPGCLFIMIAWMISQAQPFTLSKNGIGIVGIISLLGILWLYYRAGRN